MQVNYNNNFRYSGPTNLPELLDSYSFANYFNEMSVNQGNQIIFTEETMQRIQDYMAGKSRTQLFPTERTGISTKKPMTMWTGIKCISNGHGAMNTTSV